MLSTLDGPVTKTSLFDQCDQSVHFLWPGMVGRGGLWHGPVAHALAQARIDTRDMTFCITASYPPSFSGSSAKSSYMCSLMTYVQVVSMLRRGRSHFAYSLCCRNCSGGHQPIRDASNLRHRHYQCLQWSEHGRHGPTHLRRGGGGLQTDGQVRVCYQSSPGWVCLLLIPPFHLTFSLGFLGQIWAKNIIIMVSLSLSLLPLSCVWHTAALLCYLHAALTCIVHHWIYNIIF